MDLLPPITTAKQFRERNDAAKLELKELIASGNAFAVVGAGSSKRVGYPLWDEFLVKLYQTFDQSEHASIQSAFLRKVSGSAGGAAYDQHFPIEDFARGQPLALASVLEEAGNRLGGRFFRNQLQSEFVKSAVPAPEHEAMLKLPFRGVLTTNYDFLLENALDKLHSKINCDGLQTRSIDLDNRRNCLYRFLNPSSRGLGDARLVLHLHGVADMPQHCIITEEDYARAYPSALPTEVSERNLNGFHLYFLNSLAGMHRIVFFGFSYSDPFIKRVIRQCSSNLWLDGRPMHYLIDGMSPETAGDKMTFARQLMSNGIQLVCFDEPHRSYQAFSNAIDFLGREKIPESHPPQPSPSSTINRTMIEEFAKRDEKYLEDEKKP
jgi:hypothetical protein